MRNAAAAAALLALGAVVAPPSALGADRPPRCPEPAPLPESSIDAPSQTVQILRPAQIEIEFAGRRGTTDRSISIETSADLEPGAIVVAEVRGDLQAVGRSRDTFPAEGIIAQPVRSPSGALTLDLCLDPRRPEDVRPGHYFGEIRLSGSVERKTILLEVMVRDPAWVAIAWAVAGLIFGLALKTAADLTQASPERLDRAALLAHMRRPSFATAVLVGAVGVLVTYDQLYDASPVWGQTADHVKIFAAGVTLQVTGMTVVDLLRPIAGTVKPGAKDPDRQSPERD